MIDVGLPKLVDYQIVEHLPLPEPTAPLTYYLAANGVFAQGERDGLRVLVPIAASGPIRGLQPLQPVVEIPQRVPKALVLAIWRQACLARAADGTLLEMVCHLHWQSGWQLQIPPQSLSTSSCQPLADDSTSSYHQAVIDLHSHATMGAYFSTVDDADEVGFRIYAVLGRVDTRHPEMAVRVGLHGHWWPIPADWVFELPDFIESVGDRSR